MRFSRRRWLAAGASLLVALAGVGLGLALSFARGDDGAPARVAPPASVGGVAGGEGGRPDLVLRAVTSKRDRLTVLISNEGDGDYAGAVLIVVNGGVPVRVEVGTALHPGQGIEAVLETEYVQRRARVAVEVRSPDIPEASLENNRVEVVVGPDQPINLALESASVDPVTGRLTIDVRNRGPIPLVGTLTMGVRETPPSNRLVAATDGPLEVGPGGVQHFQMTAPTRIDLSRMTVSISTDAIADSDPADDTYPR